MKRANKFSSPFSLINAVKKGDLFTKLSFLICGAGNIARKQFVKGFLFLTIEVGYVLFMITNGIANLKMLPSLGWLEQQEVYNESKGIYEYVIGHQSVLILLYGVITIWAILSSLATVCGTLEWLWSATIISPR